MRALCSLVCILLCASTALAAEEARCTQLDNDGDSTTFCGCSEPLDNNDTVSTPSWDPSDSPNSKECNNGTNNSHPLGLGSTSPAVDYGPGLTFSYDAGGTFQMSTSAGIDVPLTGATYVFSGEHVAPLNAFWGRNMEFTDATVCERFYVHLNASEWGSLEPGNNKLFRWGCGAADNGNGNQKQCLDIYAQWKGAGGVQPYTEDNFSFVLPTVPNVGFQLVENWAGTASPSHGIQDCKSDWCRFEMCASHNTRSGGDADKVLLRARLNRLDGSLNSVYTEILTASAVTEVWTGVRTKLFQFESTAAPHPPTGSHTYISHIMMAFKKDDTAGTGGPAEEAFWIGAASEIEGGSSTGGTLVGGSISGGSIK